MNTKGDTARRRRRGEELLDAIRRAALDELVESGYANLTVDGIAARAGAGRASIYRYWSALPELVADAVSHSMPDLVVPPDTGDLRDQLVAVLGQGAADLNGPNGVLTRNLVAAAVQHPELVERLREHLLTRLGAPFFEILRRGVVRGEVRPGALTRNVATAGPHLLFMTFLLSTGPIPPAQVNGIVDEVLLPLVVAPGHKLPN